LFENLFGDDWFPATVLALVSKGGIHDFVDLPAKSGNEANSIEKLTNPSKGCPTRTSAATAGSVEEDTLDTIVAMPGLDSTSRHRNEFMTASSISFLNL